MAIEYCRGGCGRAIGYTLSDLLHGDVPEMEAGLMSMAMEDRDFHTCDYCKKAKKGEVE